MSVSVETRTGLLSNLADNPELRGIAVSRKAFWEGARDALLRIATVGLEVRLSECRPNRGTDVANGGEVTDQIASLAGNICIARVLSEGPGWVTGGSDRAIKEYEAAADEILQRTFADPRLSTAR